MKTSERINRLASAREHLDKAQRLVAWACEESGEFEIEAATIVYLINRAFDKVSILGPDMEDAAS